MKKTSTTIVKEFDSEGKITKQTETTVIEEREENITVIPTIRPPIYRRPGNQPYKIGEIHC